MNALNNGTDSSAARSPGPDAKLIVKFYPARLVDFDLG